MTGTERSALRLALGMLRWNVAAGRVEPHELSWKAWVECEAEAFPGDFRSPLFVADDLRDTVPWRILRARLALYIRAVLRADRGDLGEMVCPRHANAAVSVDYDDDGTRIWWCSRERAWSVWCHLSEPVRRASVARPLWLDARGVER